MLPLPVVQSVDMSLVHSTRQDLSFKKKLGLGLFGIGILMLFISLTGMGNESPWFFFFCIFRFVGFRGLGIYFKHTKSRTSRK